MIPLPQQTPWELACLLGLLRDLPKPLRLLEIGVYEGGTLYHWLQRSELVVGIDDTMRDPGPEVWNGWAQKFGADLVLLQGSSHDPELIEKAREYGPYGFCLIDADHRYEPVKADWENFRDMVQPNGIVAFHDIVPREDYGVDRLWEEIKAEPGSRTIEIIEDESPARCGIGVVYV